MQYLNFSTAENSIWISMLQKTEITQAVEAKLYLYLELIVEAKQNFNLTGFKTRVELIQYFFLDSLCLNKHINSKEYLNKIFCDIGTGAGIPGIPLALTNPDKKFYLIEVNLKKIAFLKLVLEKLELSNVEIIDIDWRQFLRTNTKIDFFLARASLKLPELLRIYKSNSNFKHSKLIYFGTPNLKLSKVEAQFLGEKRFYTIDSKPRVYYFFKNKN